MRIIAGIHRSRVLTAPGGTATRPTSDRLRETLFNVLTPQLDGARFLDLYAGSGANGLEALSRGASTAVLVEQAAPALAAIRANIAALGLEAQTRVCEQPVRRWLAAAAGEPPFGLIFLDPPYESAVEYTATLQTLGAGRLLSPGGVVVVEHRRARGNAEGTGLQVAYGALRRVRVLTQGEGALAFYAAEGAGQMS